MRSLLRVALVLAACEASPGVIPSSVSLIPVPAPVPAPIDASLVDRHPSLDHYPGASEPLRAALARSEPPREVFAALAESLAPHRWPSVLDWDRQGFIDLHGPRPGFVTRVAGTLVPQTGDRHDLGCAGGFLEGVRLTLLPRLAVDDLDRCERDLAVSGAPEVCDPEHTYGWLALANIAAQLASERLPDGPRLHDLDPRDDAELGRLASSGAMHLCAVSHTAARREHARYHHHLMIVLGTDTDDLDVFDTTGARGVALTRMSRPHFTRYCATQLAMNHEFRYLARSARLTCLRVTPAG